MIKHLFLFFLLCFSSILIAQNKKFTRQDSLRGSITKERVWWNLLHYDLQVKIDAENKYISGSNTVRYEVLKNHQVLQIDLQDPMQIISITQNKQNLNYKKEGNAYFIELLEKQKIGDINALIIAFQGKPKEAKNPPWDGGFTWKRISNLDENSSKTQKNKNIISNFIANSNQGIGASIWWPCKDNPYDEPDNGINIKVTPPKGLMAVSNGRLKKVTENHDGTKTYHWEVKNPINSYAVNVNIANYEHFSEIYNGENGNLDCDYYVLPKHLKKAKLQFQQVPKMLEAFEYWFGPYPFYKDSFKLVEVPYLGMEHQSSITYGNGFENGYLKKDLSGTGWGLKFDFIIIHESGHEWFANNITNKDVADMWIHEGFTTYSEVLYVDYHFGKKAGNEYLIGYRKKVKNDRPIIGEYKVNYQGSNDIYIKGAAMIHTIRQIVNDDDKFRNMLRGLNKDFYHKNVSSDQIEKYISNYSGYDLSAFFDQYLRTIKIPKLEYRISAKQIKYRFGNTVKGFQIPVKVYINNVEKWIHPTTRWQEIQTTSKSTIRIDDNFYIYLSK
ncbi:MAG: M1 family metallopeptidase [Flavobacteriaceae bacterium]|nr:M1 family metallopeptidase [Flavobacteriaceae bacterium]